MGRYKVFEHFRSLGFVVKAGLNFGVDFTIYRTLPSHCHSELCVYIVNALDPLKIHQSTELRDTGSNESKEMGEGGRLNWRHVSTLTRVMPDVMKILLFAYVVPSSLDFKNKGDNENSNEKSNKDNNNNYNHHNHDNNCNDSNDKNQYYDWSIVKSLWNFGQSVLSPFQSIFGSQQKIKTEIDPKKAKVSPYLNMIYPRYKDDENHQPSQNIDFSTPSCLEQLVVRPVTSLIRR